MQFVSAHPKYLLVLYLTLPYTHPHPRVAVAINPLCDSFCHNYRLHQVCQHPLPPTSTSSWCPGPPPPTARPPPASGRPPAASARQPHLGAGSPSGGLDTSVLSAGQ